MSKREALIYTLLAGASLTTIGFMVYAGRPSSASWFVEIAGIAAWALTPFATSAIATFLLRTSPASVKVLLAAAVLLFVSSTGLLIQAMLIAPDAQGGLIFIFLPLYQLVGLSSLLLVAAWCRRRHET